jgi:hypothetical protein
MNMQTSLSPFACYPDSYERAGLDQVDFGLCARSSAGGVSIDFWARRTYVGTWARPVGFLFAATC